MSANSPIESITAAVASWLGANFGTYIDRANTGMTYQASNIAECKALPYIPDRGPFPFVMVNPDSVDVERSGQCVHRVTVTLSVNILVREANKDDLGTALMRYMDALIDAVGANATMGGTVDDVYISTIDKGEMPADGRGFVMATLIASAESAL